ncbi:Crp/Fnr family transcriptional regulator [Microvirga terricola]|uniref:Crp/Fnr family transcriptional regulator n=1 Tax=Microvirga terricola TaxID=2719797 RepID=A0ABX0V9P1_9HYPH|nr:Crp/Fnr family transcriptional regulator [Microvirga terricola]NIX75919.1 Crp/Fnr family transcriptional regulator [Microvirga terricola]
MLLSALSNVEPLPAVSEPPASGGAASVEVMADDEPTIGLLAGLDPAVAAELLEQAERRVVRADEVLFTAGQLAHSVHVLGAGAAKLVQAMPGGAQIIVKYVRPGEIFGSPALLDRFYPTDAVAVTEGVELRWSSQLVRTYIDRHPRVAFNVIGDLEARLREMESRLRDLSKEPVEQRLARAILKLVEMFGRQTREGVEIPFPVSRQDLADLIGSTLPTVSRTVRAWEAQRQIRRSRRRLVIADVEAVARILYQENAREPDHERGRSRTARQ